MATTENDMLEAMGIVPLNDDTEREIPDEAEIQDTVRSMVDAATDYMVSVLDPEMADATDRYQGRPLGNEREGRSKYVARTTYETVHSQLASLCRVFYGPNNVVEFSPRRPDQRTWAKQATKAVNHIVDVENDGFSITYNWMKDALVRRIGVVKFYYEEAGRVEGTQHTNLTATDIAFLQQNYPDLDLTIIRQYEPRPMEVAMGEPDEPRFDIEVVRQPQTGTIRIKEVPPEEFIYLPRTRDLDSAPVVAHQRMATADEAIALGIDPEAVYDAIGERDTRTNESMRHSRLPHEKRRSADTLDRTYETDKSQDEVLLTEAYILMDADGDNRSELRMFMCLGSDHEVVNGEGRGEIVDMAPFAMLTPYPEPHTLVGLSTHDAVKDLEVAESDLYRGIFNSLSESISPTTEAVASQVNMKDLISPEVSKVVRVRKPGMIRELRTSFAGADALPVLDLMDHQREKRTGQSRASQGLDADALQSSTPTAVAATVTASHLQIDMLARTFAETGFKQLYRGVLKLMVQHGVTREIRDGGQYVQVNPASWDASFDLKANVGIGFNKNEDKLAGLAQLLQMQQTAMEMGVPFVSNVEIRNAAGEMARLLGFDDDTFFQPWGPEEEQAHQEAMSKQPPPPDPNMELVKVEQLKTMSNHMEKMRELDLREVEFRADDQFELRELGLKTELEREKLRIEREKATSSGGGE